MRSLTRPCYNRASVLEYLVHQVQCLGLFSTHYHRLAMEHKDTKVTDTYLVFFFWLFLNTTLSNVVTCIYEY
jgi:hypothetical protein